MHRYDQSNEHDALLLQLYGQMVAAHELDQTMLPNARTIAQFLHTWQPPNGALFEVDDQGIWFFMGMEMLTCGGFACVWIAPRKRKSSESLRVVVEAYKIVFTATPLIFGITKQESLLPSHRYFGYHISEPIADAWAGEPGWLVYLTKADFERSRAYGWRNTNEQPEHGHSGAAQQVPV